MALKAQNNSSSASIVAKRDQMVDQYGPLDPKKRINHMSNNGTGTGPQSYESLSESDKWYAALKEAAMLESGGFPFSKSFGLIHAQERDFALMDQKLREQRLAHYHQWLARKIDWRNPASLAVWRQAAPAFFQRIVEYVNNTTELQSKVAMLVSRGFPINEEEAYLLYLIDTKQIVIPSEAPHELITQGPRGNDDQIKRGWFHDMFLTDHKNASDHIEVVDRLRTPWIPITKGTYDSFNINQFGANTEGGKLMRANVGGGIPKSAPVSIFRTAEENIEESFIPEEGPMES